MAAPLAGSTALFVWDEVRSVTPLLEWMHHWGFKTLLVPSIEHAAQLTHNWAVEKASAPNISFVMVSTSRPLHSVVEALERTLASKLSTRPLFIIRLSVSQVCKNFANHMASLCIGAWEPPAKADHHKFCRTAPNLSRNRIHRPGQPSLLPSCC